MPDDRIPVKCPHCGREYEVYPELAGMEFPCRYCGKRFRCPRIVPPLLPSKRTSIGPAIVTRLKTIPVRFWILLIPGGLLFLVVTLGLLNFFLGPWHLLLRFILWPVLLLILTLFVGLFIWLHHLMFRKEHQAQRRKAAWLVAGLGACVPLYPMTMWREGLLELLNYTIILVFVTLAVFTARLRSPEHKTVATAVSIALGAFLFLFLAWADRSEHYWTSDDSGNSYFDTRGRFTARWNHRTVYLKDDDVYWFWEGPMSATWKLHGRWQYHHKLELTLKSLNDKAVSDFIRDDKYHWYWYGEKITEGEWHLRNK